MCTSAGAQRQHDNCRDLVRELMALDFTLTVLHHSSISQCDPTLTTAMLQVVFSYADQSLLELRGKQLQNLQTYNNSSL